LILGSGALDSSYEHDIQSELMAILTRLDEQIESLEIAVSLISPLVQQQLQMKDENRFFSKIISKVFEKQTRKMDLPAKLKQRIQYYRDRISSNGPYISFEENEKITQSSGPSQPYVASSNNAPKPVVVTPSNAYNFIPSSLPGSITTINHSSTNQPKSEPARPAAVTTITHTETPVARWRRPTNDDDYRVAK